MVWQKREEYKSFGQSATSDDEDTMWTFESSAALSVLAEWERREWLDTRHSEQLDRGSCGVVVEDGRIVAIRTLWGKTFMAKMFVDATYEGDLMAVAGVSYAVGREMNSVYGETINGVQFMDIMGSPYLLAHGAMLKIVASKSHGVAVPHVALAAVPDLGKVFHLLRIVLLHV